MKDLEKRGSNDGQKKEDNRERSRRKEEERE